MEKGPKIWDIELPENHNIDSSERNQSLGTKIIIAFK